MSNESAGEATLSGPDALKILLAENFPRFQRSISKYQWAWEEKRWHELIFCVLSLCSERVIKPPANRSLSREAVGMLERLDLLSIETMEDMLTTDGNLNLKDSQTVLRAAVLERLGFPTDTVTEALISIAEMAHVVNSNHQGKIHVYLRREAEKMLQELSDTFTLTKLDKEQTRYIFTHWLQNVANMPLGLHNPSLVELCKTLGVEPSEFVAIADAVQLNTALIDDIVIDYMERAAPAGKEVNVQ